MNPTQSNKLIMNHLTDDLQNPVAHPRFPKSSVYNPKWVFENNMGPNPLWLMEWLTEEIPPASSSRVLDMGCGRGLTSVFLAEQYAARVVANDLWIKPTENWERFVEAGCEDSIIPIHAEAHTLPYAEGYFDSLLSVDAYHYFGTTDIYLQSHYAKFVRPGGTIGIVVPGLREEFDEVPEHLTRQHPNGGCFWSWDFWTFHSADWWRKRWENTPLVTNVRSDAMEDGGAVFLAWEEALCEHKGDPLDNPFVTGLREDADRNITFVRVIAERVTE